MTTPAERAKDYHRGSRRAEPASRSRIRALDNLGLRYVEVDDMNVVVEGTYELNLAMSFWRAIDGSSQGYLITALADDLAKRNSEKPAGGRDIACATLPTSTSGPRQVDESQVGPALDKLLEGSASLLPVVSL